MESLLLLKKISAIHAIKCLRSIDFEIAELSFDTLISLRDRIINGEEIDINSLIEEYANLSPIVSENEINSFINDRR